MTALLLALLPLVEPIPVVESIEINTIIRPVGIEAEDWWVIGFERSFQQVILRDISRDKKSIEIRDWCSCSDPRIERDNGYWVVHTNKGVVRAKAIIHTRTDYDPEALERERLPSEQRLGWPR